MHKKKSGGPKPSEYRIAVVRLGKPMHGEIFKDVLESSLLEARRVNRASNLSPEELLKDMVALLRSPGGLEDTLMRIFEVVNSGVDISVAVPELRRLLPGADPFAQDLISIILLHHHFNMGQENEVSSFLSHEDPRIARNAIEYLGAVMMNGGVISPFVPQLILLIGHKDHGVACSAFQSVEMAAYINDDHLARGCLRALYRNKSEC